MPSHIEVAMVVNVFTAAYLLEISTAAVYKAIHEGRLRGLQHGGIFWLPLSQIATRLGKTEEALLDVIGSKKRLTFLDPAEVSRFDTV